ncbi:hypothetical protein ACPBEI_07920 [Latilactobacillus sakei]
MTLITDDFSPALDRKFRRQLIDNFKKIQKFINDYHAPELPKDILTSEDLKKFDDTLTRFSDDMDEKINRLILGTDETTVRIVVEKILQEKGVI